MFTDPPLTTPPRALVIGEALVDEYPDRRVPAGAPLHVAAHLSARGWDARLATRLGDDADGRLLRAVLAACDVRDDLVETDHALPTGTVAIAFDGGGEPRYTIRRPAAWDALEGPAEAPPHDALCYGSLAARDPRARATWARLLDASEAPWRAFDVNLRPPDVDAGVLRHGLGRATLLKLSAAELGEAALVLGLAPEPGGYFEAAHGLRYVCVTQGGEGASLHRRDGAHWHASPPPVAVVDTVGAGDTLTAALLDGLARGSPEGEALEGAVRAASAVVGQRGALPHPKGGQFGAAGPRG